MNTIVKYAKQYSENHNDEEYQNFLEGLSTAFEEMFGEMMINDNTDYDC